MKNKIIIINGSGGCGKSTFVKLCNEIDSRVVELSTIDDIKTQSIKAKWWNGIKDDKGRELLSNLKDILTQYDNIPFKKVVEEVNSLNNKIIFINSREPEEIHKFKQELNAITLLIKNPNVPKITTNHADANVECYNYDYTIVNDGNLDDLKSKGKVFLSNIKTNTKKEI